MFQNTKLLHSSVGTLRSAARIAVGLASAFLVILFLLHFLEPEIDPSRRLISEYETGRFGWMMSLAFFCWGGSVLMAVVALWPSLRGVGGRIGLLWLVLIGVALLGAGIFITNASTDTTPRTANTLHGLSGAIVIFSSPIVASIVTASLTRNPDWIAARRRLLLGMLLVWAGFLAFMGPNFTAYGADPFSSGLAVGWPNRFMVVAYSLWIILIAQRAAPAPNRSAVEAA
jgi:uncharacterized protein DUF998